MNILPIKKLMPHAVLPQRMTAGSAGYDLYACLEEPVSIQPGETKLIGTGVAIAIPRPDVAAFLYARSGLATKYGIAPANCVGVVDSDYRGEIKVPLKNGGTQPFVVAPGDRIAQMVLASVWLPCLEERDALEETQRGEGGFGSSGGSKILEQGEE